MSSSVLLRYRVLPLGVAGVALLLVLPSRVLAAPVETTNFQVVVTDAETGQPLNQARLTLQFKQPGGATRFGKSKRISYSAKTNSQGKYKFLDIPKGTIMLFVTAEKHQSFGKEIELKQDNQVVEVKLKKPQPLQ